MATSQADDNSYDQDEDTEYKLKTIPESESEDDAEAAMHAMLGFSSFTTGGQRPHRNANNTAHTHPATSSNATEVGIRTHSSLTQTKSPSEAGPQHPLPRKPQNGALPSNASTSISATARPFINGTLQHGSRYTVESAGSVPHLANGVRDFSRPYTRVNEKGDAVYFQPSFVEDDPWKNARELKARRLEMGMRAGPRKRLRGGR